MLSGSYRHRLRDDELRYVRRHLLPGLWSSDQAVRTHTTPDVRCCGGHVDDLHLTRVAAESGGYGHLLRGGRLLGYGRWGVEYPDQWYVGSICMWTTVYGLVL